MKAFASALILTWVFLMALMFTYLILKCVFFLDQKEREKTMKLYKVILNFSSNTVFAVIAKSESDAVDIMVEYFSCLHQSYKASDFSVNIFDLESVQSPMIFIKKGD